MMISSTLCNKFKSLGRNLLIYYEGSAYRAYVRDTYINFIPSQNLAFSNLRMMAFYVQREWRSWGGLPLSSLVSWIGRPRNIGNFLVGLFLSFRTQSAKSA